MSPTSFQASLASQEKKLPPIAVHAYSPECVVISGISGLYPMSRDVQDFSKILYNEVNPVINNHNRWTQKHPESSDYVGVIPDLDRFDSQFFMVHKNLAQSMDPMARKILEQTYQAIYDAGLSPQHLRGKRVGVYVAVDFSLKEVLESMDKAQITSYGINGTSKAMYANRVSYWLNAKGPSITIEDASCGSLVALEEAFKAINSGTVESAIVAGASTCFVPHPLIHYKRCFSISPDGKTRSFDQNANGCAKSEAIGVLFLQKAKHALRTYAEIVNIKNLFLQGNTGLNGQIYGFARNPDVTAEFLSNFYAESQVSPQDIEYIEAFGIGSSDADKSELQTIEKVFCKDRSEPLFVGSVISNVGFTDAATGVTSITKVLLGYQRGLIASNINCESPRQDISALNDGRMRIVTNHVPFRGTYAAINCMSYTGVNSHVLLRGCSKPKDLAQYITTIPRLLTMSARQKQYLKDILFILKSKSLDPEEIALIQNIHSKNIFGHLGRGYMLLDTDEDQQTVCLSECIEHSDDTNRPLWFVYSGMGSQWAGMGAQLMRIPIFAAAIQRCHNVLEFRGVNILNIITSSDSKIFDNILNSFVGISAIQIGITDILKAVSLYPVNMIGHSVGELGCAYADGCLTAEETILAAYSRGKAVNDAHLERGAMAAVGLGYKQIKQLFPPSVEVACHNSTNSCTISGPEATIREIISVLTVNGVFAKEVPSSNRAFHSSYIANAGPLLLELLSEIIKEPKLRSSRWISTSVPQIRWNEPAVQFCSAEYLTNNLLSPVLFEEALNLVPNNAVLVEIAPHGLMQAILNRALPSTCKNIPLTQRKHDDNVVFFLEAIGRLYVEGFNPDLQAIYPKVEFPVSVKTRLLSHLVKWNHDDVWEERLGKQVTKHAASCDVKINVHDDEYSYLTGNVIKGQISFPFAGTLVAVWDTLAMTFGYPKRKMPVRFHDVHLFFLPILEDLKQLKLYVSIHRGSGRFEVLGESSKIATGFIKVLEESKLIFDYPNITKSFKIESEEIYINFKNRGYSYRDAFKTISSVDDTINNALVIWNDNWITFIDGLLQLNILKSTYNGFAQPCQIRDLIIDVEKHTQLIQANLQNGTNTLFVTLDEVHDCTRCGGVLMHNLKIDNVPSFNEVLFQLRTPTEVIRYMNDSTENRLSSENNLSLRIGEVSNIESLHWEETPQNHCKGGIKVLVEYAGINISDSNKALGITQYDASLPYFGMDFSGVTEHGESVMGIVREGAASTVVSVQPELLWPVPKHWTLEDAATVPLAYTQAFYYLCVKNELIQGWKVLVHGAAGALGQAAISIALGHGCRVFATVSDSCKKSFLLKMFPQLKESDIGYSRNDSFGDLILNATDGQGCNIVLSCVRGDLKNISLKCAGFSGVTIDMVQIQDRDKFEYGMFNMTKQRSYIAADFYSVLESGNLQELTKLQMLVVKGITRGYVRPLTRITFGPQQATRAFRLLAASNHRGRVLLHVRDYLERVRPRITCSSNHVQAIVCDDNSFGLQLADRLIARGAKKLRILFLAPIRHLALKLRSWKKAGVDVEVSENDDDPNVAYVFMHRTIMTSSIEGMYIVLSQSDCCYIEEMIENLDTFCRKLQLPLKYFAVINNNQVHRGIATCLSRAKDGLPATSLQLPDFTNEAMKFGTKIEEYNWNRSALNVTELALRSKYPVLYAQSEAIETPSLTKLFPVLAEGKNDDYILKNLGLTESAAAIHSYLKNAYNIFVEPEHLLYMTQKELLQTEVNAVTEITFNKKKLLDIFFSIKEHDEIRASTELYPMDSLITDVDATLGAIEIDSPHNMFIIPGLEGHYDRFTGLCERLKMSAFVLQQGLERPHETARDIANRFSKILLEQFKLEKTKKFHLLSYEFGLNIVLELTAILEDHGLVGTVYCIGDGPDEMKTFLKSILASFKSAAELQEALVRTVYTQMTDESILPLEAALSGCNTWQDRIEACVRCLLGKSHHSSQYIKSLLRIFLERLNIAADGISWTRALRSQLILLRAHNDVVSAGPCSLQRYTQHSLITHELSAPLAHAAADPRVPGIVNKYLDSQLLENYEARNVCQRYVYIG